MKAWNFKVKSNPQELSQKLNAAFGSGHGFVFKTDRGTNDSFAFNVRKRDIFLSIHHNNIVASGKALKTGHKNEFDVAISFKQHFSITLYESAYLVMGLLGIISGVIYGTNMYWFGGLLFAIGIAVLFDGKKRFKKNIQEYKALISEVLELKAA